MGARLLRGLFALVFFFFACVAQANRPPDCDQAYAWPDLLWPPHHQFTPTFIKGVSDPDGDAVFIKSMCVRQDEPADYLGDGFTLIDAIGVGTPLPWVRAERSAHGNGRFYHVGFKAWDVHGQSCRGSVTVEVPRRAPVFPFQLSSKGKTKGAGSHSHDEGPLYPSTPFNLDCSDAPENRPPVAQDLNLATDEDVSLRFSFPVSDPDGDVWSVRLLSQPQFGSLVLEGSEWVYTPHADASGQEAILYSATDGELESAPATIEIDVKPVNDPPSGEPLSLVINEDSPVLLRPLLVDIEGDELSILIEDQPNNGQVISGDGAIEFIPAHDFHGMEGFSYRVSDGTDFSPAYPVSIQVLPVNDAPEAQGGRVNVAEDGSATIFLDATDRDGDALTVTIVHPPAYGLLDGQGLNRTYTPIPDYYGPDSFEFRVSDGALESAIVTMSIEVQPANDIPIVSAVEAQLEEDTAAEIPLQGSDADGDQLTYRVTTPPAHGQAQITGSSVNYVPDADFNGTDVFSYTATDGQAEAAPAEISLTVSPVNDAPVIRPQAFVVDEDQTAAWMLDAEDVDGDPLIYNITSPPMHGQAEVLEGVLHYQPAPNYFGEDFMEVTVSDGLESSLSALVSISVTPVADSPVITGSLPTSAASGVPLYYPLMATDADGDALFWSLVTSPAGMMISGVTGELFWTPSDDQQGPHVVTVRLEDSNGLHDEVTWVISVVGQTNGAPVITSAPPLSADLGQTWAYQIEASDPDADPLSYSLVRAPAGLKLGALSGSAAWSPKASQTGRHRVQVRVQDPSGASVDQVWDIHVGAAPDNQPPQINSTPSTAGRAGSVYQYQIVASDPDGDALSYVLGQAPDGLVVSATGLMTFVPEAPGDFAVSLSVTDGRGASASQSWQVEVQPPAQPALPAIVSTPPSRVREGNVQSYLPSVIDADPSEQFTWVGQGMLTDPESGFSELRPDGLPHMPFDATNPQCDRSPPRLDQNFQPLVKWHWDGSDSPYPTYNQVMTTPIVAPLVDTDGDGGLGSGDDAVVLFYTYQGRDYGGRAYLRAISAVDGAHLWSSAQGVDFNAQASVAVADVDNDGDAEIAAGLSTGGLALFDHTGALLWRSQTSVNGVASAPSFADLDQDGTTEILFAGVVMDNLGQTIWQAAEPFASYQMLPVDLDMDGDYEIATAQHVYDHQGNLLFPLAVNPRGGVAVANLDGDPFPEIAVVIDAAIEVYQHDGAKWYRIGLFDRRKKGGAPTIADMDGDGLAEIGVAGGYYYMVYSNTGVLQWRYATRDYSSGATGSTVFDFDGNGRAEVVYNDEFFLRVFDGPTGTPIYQIPSSSITGIEYPVVADIDADGHAEILVANNNSYYGGVTGVRAIEAAEDDWVSTRNIWNQAPYHIDNILDDMTVPSEPGTGWLEHNTYRSNRYPLAGGLALPDYAVTGIDGAEGELVFDLANLGKAPGEKAFWAVSVNSVQQATGEISALAVGQRTQVSVDQVAWQPGDRVRVEVSPAGADCVSSNHAAEAEAVALTVTDRFGLTDSQSWLLTVIEENDAPVINSGLPDTLPDGERVTLSVNMVDPDRGDDHVFGLVGAPADMYIDPNTGEIDWDIPAGLTGSYDVTVSVTDLAGASAEYRWQFEVAPPDGNRAPSITSRPQFGAEVGMDYAYELQVDDDGNGFTWVLLDAPEGMGLSDAGVLTWLPSAVGNYPVSVQVTDEGGRTDAQEWIIVVTDGALNGVPLFISEPLSSAVAGGRYVYSFAVTDPDGDALNAELMVAPPGAEILLAEQSPGLIRGELVWPVPSGRSGLETLVIRATDSNGALQEQRILLEILPEGTNLPPAFLSLPPVSVVAGQVYVYPVNVMDPEGQDVRLQLLEAPPGAVLAGELFSWDAANASSGDEFFVTLLATDPQGNETRQHWPVQVRNEQAPEILSVPGTQVRVGEAYQYAIQALDAQRQDLTYMLVLGPRGMALSESGDLLWVPTVDQAGTYDVIVEVSDEAGEVARQRWSLEAWVDYPPAISSLPPASVVQQQLYQYQVVAEDDLGLPLAYSLGQTPAGMAIDAHGLLTWLPESGDVGEHDVEIRVSDGRFYTQQHFTVVVNDQALPLQAVISVEPAFARPNEAISIRVQASGGLTAPTVEARLDGEPLVLVDGQAEVRFSESGRHEVSVTVQDDAESLTREAVFAVSDGNDTEAPVVDLVSPSWNQEVTAPVDIVGSVADENLASYRVAWKRAGSDEQQVLAEGSAAVPERVLATLDPTTMLNGLYYVVLEATDLNGQTSSAAKLVRVDGNLKVGHFSITLEDLSVPLAGIPIRVTRTYDTRQRHQRLDFGYGWSIGYQDVRIDESGEPTSGWRQTTENHLFVIDGQQQVFRATCTRPLSTREVAVTLPDGEVERFTVRAEAVGGGVASNSDPSCYLTASRYFNLAFEPDSRTDSTLTAEGTQALYLADVAGGDLVADLTSGAGQAIDRYTLTTREGYVYELDQHFGVRRVIDPNGQTLEYSDQGIVHSSGRQIQFERNGKGQIMAVIDPDGRRFEYRRDANGDLVAVTDPLGHEAAYTYHGRSHRLADMLDPLGRRVVRNLYDGEGRLVAQEDNQGNRTNFNHDIAGRQSVVTDRRGHATAFYYDDRGNITSKLDAEGRLWQYTYDEEDNQLSETNPLGHRSQSTFNDRGDQLASIDALGNITRFEYNARGQETRIVDAKGQAFENGYDSVGNLLSIQDPAGNTATNAINGDGLVERTTDLAGNVTRYAYDGFGHKTQEVDAEGQVTTWAYDDRGNVISETVTRSQGAGAVLETTRYTYDELNRVVAVTDPLGHVSRTEFDAAGNEVASVDALGRRTEYVHDAYGRVLETHYPDGSAEYSVYDAEGNVIESTDRLGRTTYMRYDRLNRLVGTTYPDGAVMSTEYDAAGRVLAEVDARGQRTRYEYDAAGRRTAVINALGQRHEFEYDPNGNLVREQDANGHVTTYGYNALDQRVETRFHDATTVVDTFDALSRKVASQDQAGVITAYHYDGLGRLTGVTDALGGETTYTYDSQGNKLTQTDAEGRTTRWEYDALGRVTARILPLGQRETFEYDASGNQIRHVDFNGQVTTSEYDVMNRLVRRSYDDGTQEAWRYDAGGRVIQTTLTTNGQAQVTDYAYDSRDRLIQETKPDGSVLEYTYDLNGNKTSVTTTPAGGSPRTVSYTYDALNRLKTVVDEHGTTTYTYDAVGNRASVTQANGVETVYSYDALNRLTQLTSRASDGTILQQYDYTLDATGRRTLIEEHSGRVSAYVYDDLYRLVEEAISDPVNGDHQSLYQYDAVGNRTQATVNGVATFYDYDDNDRLLSQGGSTYTYDANGNTLAEISGSGSTSYVWDARNRLVEATTPAGTLLYGYDINGIRTSRAEGGVITNFVVDHNQQYAQVLAETEGGATTKHYTYGDDLLSQTAGAGQERFFLYDGLGTTRALADGAEAVTDTYAYEAFGELLASTGGSDNAYRYTGEQYDSGLDQYYLRARYYYQGFGRFTQMDTFSGYPVEPESLHKYAYVKGDPVQYVDPSGEVYTPFGIGDIGFAIDQSYIIRSAQSHAAKKQFQRILFGRPPGDLGIVGEFILDNVINSVVSILGAEFPNKGAAGTRAHQRLERRIRGFKPIAGLTIEPEVFFDKQGNEVKSGNKRKKGNLGIDILIYRHGNPVLGIDLKIGRGFSKKKLRKLSKRAEVPIVQIFVGVKGK